MIEISILPFYVMDSADRSFPISNGLGHAGKTRERKYAVGVIWHEQKQLTPPFSRMVIMLRRGDQRYPEILVDE